MAQKIESREAAAIEIDDFSFAYPDGPWVLNAVTWRVSQGAFELVTGDTGCGKTTLLRNVKPEIAPAGTRQGEVRVFDQPIQDWDAPASSTAIGYVAQSPENQMVCDTVWHELAFGLENVGTPQEVMRRRVAEVAHFFGIEPWIHRACADLSGGQKQMVNLAAVLAMQPKLLLLDEPTAQLDPVAEKNFLHALFRINRELGITVVVATHAPEAMADYATSHFELAGCVAPQGASALQGSTAVRSSRTPQSAGMQQASAAVPQGKPSRSVPRTNTQSFALEAHDAFFRYTREDDWVLRGCNLSVYPSEMHALVGGNGSGKSTLLRLIAGVLKPERGRVRNMLSRTQAFLPQDPKALFVCDTVEEELTEWQRGCGYGDDAIEDMLARFDLTACRMRHPYDVSGGQQQKLALAKVLLTKPALLLLDEPTKGLDGASKCMVAQELCAFSQAGGTIVMATHDLSFASCVADVCTMLFDGEATCTEPTKAFFENNLFYRPQNDAFSQMWHSPASALAPELGHVSGSISAPVSVSTENLAPTSATQSVPTSTAVSASSTNLAQDESCSHVS